MTPNHKNTFFNKLIQNVFLIETSFDLMKQFNFSGPGSLRHRIESTLMNYSFS